MSSKKPQRKPVPVKTEQKKQQSRAVKPGDLNKFAYLILIALGILFYFYTKTLSFIQDDSFITYRYVKNFTDGAGLVFNIGERVEGYTCFLWVMLLSTVKKLGFDFISASQTLGIIFSLLTVLFTYNISERIFPKGKDSFYNFSFNILAVILLAANGAFAYWSVSGMETGMFTFLVTLGVFMYLSELREKKAFGYSSVVLLLASLTRPEGNLIFAVAVLHKLIFGYLELKKEGKPISELFAKDNLKWLGAYIVPALIYMTWRYSYYGYWFPNTFYAKTGSSIEYYKTGLDYFWEFAKAYGLYGAAIAITLFSLRSKKHFSEYAFLLMTFFIFSLYVIFVGGDVLRPNRFFVPMLPVFYILLQEGLHNLFVIIEGKKGLSYSPIIALVVVVGFAYYTYRGEVEQITRYSELENGLVEKMKIGASWFKNKQVTTGKQLTVAATTIGAFSYYSDVTLIDMLGLCDKEIAHNPKPIEEISANSEIGWKERHYNVDYVLSRKPDYIYFSTGLKPSAYAERGLFTSEEFIKYYYPTYFVLKDYNFSDVTYKRKSEQDAAKSPAPQTNPNYKKTFVNLYTQAMNTGKDNTKMQEAITLYQQSADQGPNNWGAPYNKIGDLYLQAKDKEKAFENFKKAVDINDFNVISHYSLFQLYMERGDTVNARTSYDKVYKYAPEMVR